jgi:hypothetical protein
MNGFDIHGAVSRALVIDRARLDRAVAKAMDEQRGLTPDEIEAVTPPEPPAPEEIPAVTEEFFEHARMVIPALDAVAPDLRRVPAVIDTARFEGEYRRAWLVNILPPRHRALAFLDQPTVKSDLKIEQVKCLFNFWLLVSLHRQIAAGTAPEALRSVTRRAIDAEIAAYKEIGKFAAALKRLPPAPTECPRCGYALPAPNGRQRPPQRP